MESKKNAHSALVGVAGARLVSLLNSLSPKTKETFSRVASSLLTPSKTKVDSSSRARADAASANSKAPWVAAGVVGGMALWYLGTRHRDEPKSSYRLGSEPSRIRDPDPTMRL